MGSDVSIASLLRVHRGTAEPEELAAIAVVVACLTGRAAQPRPRPGRRAHHRPRPRAAGHGCWAGCWACR
ncbi:acyl-CoA carboxylase subunit epsilon [Streptomyces sp. NPDC031705]|uniref:acyl-CoA carboxylase subunit epsilon n=1 Tax=unclassified Streptomyces TaxID=2593676 RepID=UPI0033F7A0A1